MHRSKGRATFNIALSRQDLEIINNALNEVCHGLDLEEFVTRMGSEQAGSPEGAS